MYVFFIIVWHSNRHGLVWFERILTFKSVFYVEC